MVYLSIVLYGIVYTVAEYISLLMKQRITASAMVLYTALYVLWLRRTNRHQAIGLYSPAPHGLRACLRHLPLYILPLFQFVAHGLADAEWDVLVLLLSGAVMEEIFFRGFLLHWLSPRSRFTSILATSLFFALFHGVNLFAGLARSYVLLQMLCAFCVSIAFCAVSLSDGLLPCMTAHCLINLTGAGDASCAALPLLLCAALYVIYGIWFCQTARLQNKETPT